METNRKFDIRVGIFVFIGVVLLLASILVVGGDKVFLASYVQYKGLAKSTQGLATGSIVSLSGIRVGNVRRVIFNESTDDLVIIMDIEEQYQKRITTASSFAIKTQGALGDRYVYIEPGLEPGEPLPPGEFIKSSAKKDLFDVIASKGGDFGKAADIIVEVHKLLLNINEDNRSKQLMENLVEVSSNLNGLIKETHSTVKSFKKDLNTKEFSNSVTHLTSIMKKIDKGDGTLGALVNDSAIHHRLLKILGAPERNKYLKPLIRRSIKQNDQIRQEKTSYHFSK